MLCPNHASYLDPLALAAALPWPILRQVYWAGAADILFPSGWRRAFSRTVPTVNVRSAQDGVPQHRKERTCKNAITDYEWPMSDSPQFAGAYQPARRDFGIANVIADDGIVPVHTRDVVATPFCTLVEFARSDVAPRADLLVIAPLSGHFPFLLRDLVIGLLPFFRVYVTDWTNVRHVPAEHGSFGLDTNISGVLSMIRSLAPGMTVVALCQGGVPALAATALLAHENDARTPAALVLMAAPIDPLANPTPVVRLLRARSLSWFEENLITTVPEEYAGRGRRVYPARFQLMALRTYLARRISEGGELSAKLLSDDGADPAQFPFLDLYTSIMDLDAKFLVDNTKAVFHDCLLRNGRLFFGGERVDPAAIRDTALLTVEGAWDDIAAPGQTSAAHGLCTSLPARLRREMIVPHSGHFSLFYGETWRREVLPAIKIHCGALERHNGSEYAAPLRNG